MDDGKKSKKQLMRELAKLKLGSSGTGSGNSRHIQRSILDSITDAAWFKDREGHFLAVNKPFQQTLGLAPEEIIGRTDFEAWPRDLAEKWRADDLLVMESGQIKLTEEQFFDKEGNRSWIESIKLPIFNERQHVVGIVGITRNITDRKEQEAILRNANAELEKQLRQAQKLEALGTLAGGIAHDFNNILTAIVASASLMQRKIDEKDPLRRQLDRIFTACERATALTQGILAYSRRQVSKPAPVKLNQIIGNMHKLLGRLVPENIDFSISLAETDLTIMADPGQIEQVLMNLVTNAIDAMPGGGELAIRTELAPDREFTNGDGQGKPGDYAILRIADNGIGMEAKTMERIFEPFFTTKEVGKGTGLGLATVYGIVRQHEGFIDVSSKPGQGALFSVYLPLIATDVKKSPLDDAWLQRGRNETILLIEDDKDVRDLLKEMLASCGYQVIEAVDGNDGVEKFVEHQDRISLVLTDVMMPKKNGKEAYNEIREIKGDVKAIFISGYSAAATLEILGTGPEHLAKPVSPQELLAKIREVLDK